MSGYKAYSYRSWVLHEGILNHCNVLLNESHYYAKLRSVRAPRDGTNDKPDLSKPAVKSNNRLVRGSVSTLIPGMA